MELTQYIDEKMIENKDVKDYGKDYEYTYQFEPLMDELFELRKQHGNKLLKTLSDFIFTNDIKQYNSIELALEFLSYVDAKETLVNILDNHTNKRVRYLAFKSVSNHIDILEARYKTELDKSIQDSMVVSLLLKDIYDKNRGDTSVITGTLHAGRGFDFMYEHDVKLYGVETTIDNIKHVLKSKYITDENRKKTVEFLASKG